MIKRLQQKPKCKTTLSSFKNWLRSLCYTWSVNSIYGSGCSLTPAMARFTCLMSHMSGHHQKNIKVMIQTYQMRIKSLCSWPITLFRKTEKTMVNSRKEILFQFKHYSKPWNLNLLLIIILKRPLYLTLRKEW